MTESKYILESKDLIGETITHVRPLKYWDVGLGITFVSGKRALLDCRNRLGDPGPIKASEVHTFNELAELLVVGWITPIEYGTLEAKIKARRARLTEFEKEQK